MNASTNARNLFTGTSLVSATKRAIVSGKEEGSGELSLDQPVFVDVISGERIKCRLFSPGPLAQLVEQRTFNPLVAGSNPARPTSFKKRAAILAALFVFRTDQRISRLAR